MKLTVALIAGLFAVSASAESIVGYTQARVLSVTPITVKSYRSVPRQSCTVVENYMLNSNGVGQVIDAPQTNQNCTSYHDREYFERVTGYNVTFEYSGQLRTTRMNRDPGNTVTIKTVTKVYAVE